MKTFTLSKNTARLIINEDIDLEDVLAQNESRIQDGEDVLLQERYDDVASSNGLHPDNDFEEILEILYEEIVADFG